jgi:rhodanese-related sulfurtransferase
VVFACDDRVRATVTASWYRQMGFPNVYAVEGGTKAWAASRSPLEQSAASEVASGYDEGLLGGPYGYADARAQVELLTPEALQTRLDNSPTPVVIFVDTSRDFSHGHIPRSRWISRSWLELRIGDVAPDHAAPVVVTCADGLNSVLAGATLKSLGYQQVAVLDGGLRAWTQAGLAVERGLSGVMSPPNDVLVMGTDRNWADAMHYLRWEEELGHKYASKAE